MKDQDPITPSEDGIVRIVLESFQYAPEFRHLADAPCGETETCTWTGESLAPSGDPNRSIELDDGQRDR